MPNKPFRSALLLLVILLLGVITAAQAQEKPGVSFDNPIAYEAVLINDGPAELQLLRLEAEVPPGTAYVGLAAGSQVSQEAQRLGNRLVWEGPFALPSGRELTVRYWLAPTSPALQLPVMNIVAQTSEETTLQAPAQPAELPSSTAPVVEGMVSPEAVTVVKVAETPELHPDNERWIAYAVTFTNNSVTPATLDSITDTLAPGFEFVGMAVGSDVGDESVVDPSASTIVWQGPFAVPSAGSGVLTLRYWVKAVETFGTYVNTVEAVGGGIPVGPDTATVTISPYRLYLPSIIYNYPPPPPVLLDEDFTTGVPPEWTPVRMPAYWEWTGDGVTWGRYDFLPGQEYSQWGVSLYLGEGAEAWTDYKIEATFRTGWHFKRPLVCLLFRDTYNEQNGFLSGYTFCLQPRDDLLDLGRIDPSGQDLDITWVASVSRLNDVGTWYDVVIEARGANIKVWFDGVPVFNWTDPNATWMQGTVGFAAYRGEGQFDDIRITPLQ